MSLPLLRPLLDEVLARNFIQDLCGILLTTSFKIKGGSTFILSKENGAARFAVRPTANFDNYFLSGLIGRVSSDTSSLLKLIKPLVMRPFAGGRGFRSSSFAVIRSIAA